MLAYVCDEQLKQELHAAGRDDWELYIGEMTGLLGVQATLLSIRDLEDRDLLSTFKTLLIGAQSGSRLTGAAIDALDSWVAEGGILIGFAVSGLDRLFGIRSGALIRQMPDDYAISAYFDLYPHALTKEIHPILFNEQKLIIISDVREIDLNGAAQLGHLYDSAGNDLQRPAVVWNSYGKGYAGYFAFDAAKTVWLLHQGKPVPRDAVMSRSKAALLSIVGDNSRKIAYADEIVFLIQNMIAQNHHPFIYQIPPDGETIPDALFYWSGDEYYGPVELSLGASDWMKDKGLPYHINIGVRRPGSKDGHPMTEAELNHIRNNGHEISLWFNMTEDDNRFAVTEESIRHQSDLFYDRFGFRPGSTLMHSTSWQGGVEPARWMAESGIQADNTFNGSGYHGEHPSLNSPFYAFGFGTAYPFYFYDTPEFANRKLDFIEQPMVCYELGHRGSVIGLNDKETATPEEVYLPIEMAVKHHQVINFFYHPVYIVNFPRCREAIEEIIKYIEWKRHAVLHMGSNRLCDWWKARSRSKVEQIHLGENSIEFAADCQFEGGMAVKIPSNGRRLEKVLCDGQPASFRMKQEFGREWLYLIIPNGKHQATVGWA